MPEDDPRVTLHEALELVYKARAKTARDETLTAAAIGTKPSGYPMFARDAEMPWAPPSNWASRWRLRFCPTPIYHPARPRLRLSTPRLRSQEPQTRQSHSIPSQGRPQTSDVYGYPYARVGKASLHLTSHPAAVYIACRVHGHAVATRCAVSF